MTVINGNSRSSAQQAIPARGGRRRAVDVVLRLIRSTPLQVVLVFIALIWMMPTFGLFLTSLLAPGDATSAGWWQIFTEPSKLTFQNYEALVDNEAIMSSLWTTALISVGGTALPILLAALASYAFAWMEFRGRDMWFLVVVALMVVPAQMAFIPIFSLYNSTGLFDTVVGLVLFHTAFGLPFGIFLLRNAFSGIPSALIEAARIDGASDLWIFAKVVLPLGRPAVAALATFQFLWVWNDLLTALVFARDTRPITVAIFAQLEQFGSNIDVIAAGSFLSLIVPLIVFFAFQRHFTAGVLSGATK